MRCCGGVPRATAWSERTPVPAAAWRGEIWDVDLGEPIGHESGFLRPGLVISDDETNRFGLAAESFTQVESLRSISTRRLVRRRGVVGPATTGDVERILRLLLRL